MFTEIHELKKLDKASHTVQEEPLTSENVSASDNLISSLKMYRKGFILVKSFLSSCPSVMI